jgi:hypothetical protein
MHLSEQLVERPVELAEMTEAEAAQKAAKRRRLRQPVRNSCAASPRNSATSSRHPPPAINVSHKPRIACAGE